MDSAYEQWIWDNVDPEHTTGLCHHYSDEMRKDFPELILVRGYYFCLIEGKHPHWWLRTEDGVIVDPTANQFESKGEGRYEPIPEDAPEPVGKCRNCDQLFYEMEYHPLCSDMCYVAYTQHCIGAIR